MIQYRSCCRIFPSLCDKIISINVCTRIIDVTIEYDSLRLHMGIMSNIIFCSVIMTEP